MTTHPTAKLHFQSYTVDEMRARSDAFLSEITLRRSVREFSREAVPLDVIRRAIHAAAQAPSGANKQPWTFVLVTDPQLKKRIREAAEEEERAFYSTRATPQWLADLEPLGTDHNKPFIEDAPALIVVFAQTLGEEGNKHYYVKESVGIASGILLTALHHAGLATLTHTPSPMAFLGKILGRPSHEKAFLLIPVGFPAPGCRVPGIERKGLSEVLVEM
jgi:nitroreductase